MNFRELETALNAAWNDKNGNHKYLMELQQEWETQMDHLTDNPEEFITEINTWETTYLKTWVKTTDDIYKQCGEDFTAKELHLIAKQELTKRIARTNQSNVT